MQWELLIKKLFKIQYKMVPCEFCKVALFPRLKPSWQYLVTYNLKEQKISEKIAVKLCMPSNGLSGMAFVATLLN